MGLGRDGLGVWVSRCKLLYIEWINKVLLYSIGNLVQYLVISHMGKPYIYIYTHTHMCVTDSLCYIQQKLTQHCKSTILQ